MDMVIVPPTPTSLVKRLGGWVDGPGALAWTGRMGAEVRVPRDGGAVVEVRVVEPSTPVYGGADGGVRSRITRSDGECVWEDVIAGGVSCAAGNVLFTAVATVQGHMHVYSPAGRKMLPTMYLASPVAFLEAGPASSDHLLAVMSNGDLRVWKVPRAGSMGTGRVVLRTSVRGLLSPPYAAASSCAAGAPPPPSSSSSSSGTLSSTTTTATAAAAKESSTSTHPSSSSSLGGALPSSSGAPQPPSSSSGTSATGPSGAPSETPEPNGAPKGDEGGGGSGGAASRRLEKVELTPQGCPVVWLSDGRVYAFHAHLEEWAVVCSGTYVDSVVLSAPSGGAVHRMQAGHRSVARTGPSEASEVARLLEADARVEAGRLSSAMEEQMCLAATVHSPVEYRYWLHAYARHLADAADVHRAQELCTSLLANPRGKVLGMERRSLVAEVLPLLATNRDMQRTVAQADEALQQANEAPHRAPDVVMNDDAQMDVLRPPSI